MCCNKVAQTYQILSPVEVYNVIRPSIRAASSLVKISHEKGINAQNTGALPEEHCGNHNSLGVLSAPLARGCRSAAEPLAHLTSDKHHGKWEERQEVTDAKI